MNTKKIDEAINSICEWIDKGCKDERSAGDEIYKMVFALAAVMNARANMITHKNGMYPDREPTINEMRKAYGLSEIPDGDKHLINL